MRPRHRIEGILDNVVTVDKQFFAKNGVPAKKLPEKFYYNPEYFGLIVRKITGVARLDLERACFRSASLEPLEPKRLCAMEEEWSSHLSELESIGVNMANATPLQGRILYEDGQKQDRPAELYCVTDLVNGIPLVETCLSSDTELQSVVNHQVGDLIGKLAMYYTQNDGDWVMNDLPYPRQYVVEHSCEGPRIVNIDPDPYMARVGRHWQDITGPVYKELRNPATAVH